MVNQLVRFILVCGFINTATAAHKGVAMVQEITIEASGLSEHADAWSKQLCSSFQLRTDQIKYFFRHAKSAESRIFTQERYSPCYAKGNVVFKDGKHGVWEIHSGKAGVLTLSSGEGKILYCSLCEWKDPFQGAYSPSNP